MLSILAGAAALAAIAALAYFLFKKVRKNQEEQGQGGSKRRNLMDSEEESDDPLSGMSPEERRRHEEQEAEKRKRLLDSVVQSIEFSTKELVSDQPISGAKSRQSLVPNANFNVRPIRGVQECPALLPSAHLLDDDQFYGRLATHGMMVGEYVEYYGKARRVLYAAFDGSGSMKEYGRYQWAMSLCEALIDRCIKQQAEFILIVYSGEIKGVYHIRTLKEAIEVKRKLVSILFPEGGTDIDLALGTIFDMIKESKFIDARALLVTDGTESVDERHILQRRQEENIFLHTVSIAGQRDDLRRVSNRYDQVGMFSG
ncbi:VWA domain-containing protein [Candidatus Falkowbacteria bacterium]|nr:VWA domain-containing protein [Candidatus Falkowbacteria bacterium]